MQEVIVQNFRAKPRTAMQAHDDLELQEYVAAVAVTRLLLGPKARVQAPPNLSDSTELGLLLRAGIDDWGGVSPADPRPRQPRAAVAEHRQAGRARRPRPASSCASGSPPSRRYVLQPEPWLDPRVRPHVFALAGPDGLAVEDRLPVGLPWQEPDEAWTSSGRVDLHVEVDTVGRTSDRRSDFDAVYGDWSELRERTTSRARRPLHRADRRRSGGARRPGRTPSATRPGCRTPSTWRCWAPTARTWRRSAALADSVRRDVNGDDVTYVVNRNINFTNVCYTGCRFCAFAQRRTDADAYTLSMDAGRRPGRRGVGRRRDRDLHAGRHPPRPARGRRTSTWPAR